MKLKLLLYKWVLFSALIMIGTGGCKPERLDLSPVSPFIPGSPFANEEDAFKSLTGVYSILNRDETFDINFWALGDGCTDDEYAPAASTGGDGSRIGLFSIQPTSVTFSDMWSNYYEGIARANNFLQQINNSGFNLPLQHQFAGEAKFLRALYYFQLVNYFGGVPKITQPLNPNDPAARVLPRSTVNEIYTVIENDLKDASAVLPVRGSMDISTLGRITKGAAQALLAKTYLFTGNWGMAALYADSVIGSNEYALNISFRDNFRIETENSKESVFEIQNNEATGDTWSGGAGNYFSIYRKPGCIGGYGSVDPSFLLRQLYSSNDKRFKATLTAAGDVIDSVTISCDGECAKLWTTYVPGRNDANPLNWPLIRYAEVLLIKAEALVELNNNLPEAAVLINMVRARAGVSSVAVTNQDELRETLRNERHLELALEGWRLFDLRRWGTAYYLQQLQGSGKENLFEPSRHILFPIPQTEIDLSGGMIVQNLGY
jgi:starch-binding outer membrane protein, SusD/RagB family